jgi:hypothetical protein
MNDKRSRSGQNPASIKAKSGRLKTLQDVTEREKTVGQIPQSVLVGELASDRRVWTEDEIEAFVEAFQQQMTAEYDEYLRQETAFNQIGAKLGVEMLRLAGRLFPDATSIDRIWLLGEVRGQVRKKLNLEK